MNGEGKPGLQVLDTENLERGWSLLPAPPVRFHGETVMCAVVAYAAVPTVVGATSSAIFITLSNDPGTYAFDVENKVWDYVSQVDLPFSHYAMPISCAPSLYCGLSSDERRFCAFRFWYNANNRKFQVDEIKIQNSSVLCQSRELPPADLYYVWPLIAVGPFGRVYSIEVGTDDIKTWEDPTANRYVKVNAAQVCQVEPNEEKGKDEKRASKRSRTTKEAIRNNEVEDGGEFKMSKIWSRSFYGGPMGVCEDRSNVAFALY
ncbi:uncharacterized protein LOC141653781 [Silene latifolia]|uniref:uncharacterized protein LOC141653781 n=1 Tax=Silene latifolia TaxID=37657 RepID=UPI003D7704B0